MKPDTLRLYIDRLHESWAVDCTTIYDVGRSYGIDMACAKVSGDTMVYVLGLFVEDEGGELIFVFNYEIRDYFMAYDVYDNAIYLKYQLGVPSVYTSVFSRVMREISRSFEARITDVVSGDCGLMYIAESVGGDLIDYMKTSTKVFRYGGGIEKYVACSKIRIFGDNLAIASGIFTDEDDTIYTGFVAVGDDVVVLDLGDLDLYFGVDGVVGVFAEAK